MNNKKERSNKNERVKEEAIQQAEFNNTTNSEEPVNQNQNHNVKKEALGPNTRR